MRWHGLLLLLIVPLVQCALWQGDVETKSRSAFLGKFCYTVGIGSFAITATSQTPNVSTVEVFASTSTYNGAQIEPCTNKTNIFFFDFSASDTITTTIPVNNVGKSAQPQWWYVVATDCSGKLSQLEYSITFTNPGNPTFAAPFSADEQGLLIMYLVFTCVYIVLFALQVWGMHKLYRVRSLHPISVILSSITVVQFAAFFMFLEHYAAYSSNGVGHPQVKIFAELFDMLAVTVLALLFLLIAKGWGVSDNPLTHQRVLLILIVCYGAAYSVLFTWQENSMNPASVTFYYDSWPGWILVGLRFLILAFLVISVRTTWMEENHPNKRKFYATFATGASLWLIVLPIVCGLAYMIPSWTRTRVVMAVLASANTAAVTALTFLLWPTRAAHYFKIAPPELYPEESAAAKPKVASHNVYEEL